MVVQAVNAVNRSRPMRQLMDKALGVHPDAWMPSLATTRFRWSAPRKGRADTVTDGERTPGKVAIFSTCYVNYNEPGIGLDLLKVLEHNAIPYLIVQKERCSERPQTVLSACRGGVPPPPPTSVNGTLGSDELGAVVFARSQAAAAMRAATATPAPMAAQIARRRTRLFPSELIPFLA